MNWLKSERGLIAALVLVKCLLELLGGFVDRAPGARVLGYTPRFLWCIRIQTVGTASLLTDMRKACSAQVTT